MFGDIGTSPLYALQTVFTADNHAVHATPGEVYGVISLVFWSITMIVSVKYVSFIMRADNQRRGRDHGAHRAAAGREAQALGAKVTLVTLGVLGASLFYGDGVITPAISVLSAVEGLKVAAPEPRLAGAADHGRRADDAVRDPALRHESWSAACSGR